MWTSLLRLIPTVPFGKWKSFAGWINNQDKQKTAFSRAHGSFLYIMALSDDSGRQDSENCLALVKAVTKFANAAHQMLYIDARPAQRPFLKALGFGDVMSYKISKKPTSSAPHIYIMTKSPQKAAVLPRRRV